VAEDFVDLVAGRWAAERPELDVSSIAVLDRILRITQFLIARAEAVCREHGISFWAFAVLTSLRRAGPPYALTPTALYRAGMVTSGAVTRRVSELELRGLVERVPDAGDGRSVLVRLTELGTEIVDAALPDYLEMHRDVLDCLGDKRRQQLAGLLRPLLLTLEQDARDLDAVESANARHSTRRASDESRPARDPKTAATGAWRRDAR
jgi:DNA-binding MarR family transcriptional regulator